MNFYHKCKRGHRRRFVESLCLSLFVLSGVHVAAAEDLQKTALTDPAIRDAVDMELANDSILNANHIDVFVSEGIVTLQGRVGSLLGKERSAKIVETVRGVRAVVNRLTIYTPVRKTDEVLEADVTRGLLANPATEAYEVGVTAEDGVVTLTGEVDSWQERSLALKVAKAVDGVQAVEDRITFELKEDRPDEEIAEDLRETLKWNPYIDDGLIDIRAKNGVVRLSGFVGSAAEKRAAVRKAWIAGAREVQDDALEVAYWAREEALRTKKYTAKTPAAIEAALRKALSLDARVNAAKVTIEVQGSAVTLRGIVSNLAAKEAAEEDAVQTVGVSHVINRLRVRPAITLSDADLEESVRLALLRDPFVNRFDFNVTAVDGIVYLRGEVGSPFQRFHAESTVAQVNGVADVKNRVSVIDGGSVYVYNPYVDEDYVAHAFPRGERADNPEYNWTIWDTDKEIEIAIKREIFWSPFVDSSDVEVSVQEGIASLRGVVNSWSERLAALDNAFEGGALGVINLLEVQPQDEVERLF